MKASIESTNRRYTLPDGRTMQVWSGVTEDGNRVEFLVSGLLTHNDDDAAEREIRVKLGVVGRSLAVEQRRVGPNRGPETVGDVIAPPQPPRSERPFRKRN